MTTPGVRVVARRSSGSPGQTDGFLVVRNLFTGSEVAALDAGTLLGLVAALYGEPACLFKDAGARVFLVGPAAGRVRLPAVRTSVLGIPETA